MARKFLYFVAFAIFLVFAAFLAMRLMPDRLARAAFVPSADFVEQAPAPANRYADRAMWFSRAGIADDPAQWEPGLSSDPADARGLVEGAAQAAKSDRVEVSADTTPRGNAAIFFIHPTSYFSRAAWNAPLDDADANARARLFLRGMASAFNRAGEVYAPRYRQATLGAFLTTDRATADRAIAAAYADVLAAFDQFVSEQPADRPIILAGHSQGSLHLTRLLRERVAGKPLAKRIVAAYVVGWPVSLDTDVAAMGLPVCATAEATGCLIGWSSYAEPADPSSVLTVYDLTTGFDGRPRKDTRMLCVNPLTGTPDSGAEASANLGTLKPDATFTQAEVLVGAVPARCDDDRGFLLIGSPPDLGGYVLPGNNYHVYDYPLFWMNVRADVARRLEAYTGRKAPPPRAGKRR